MKKAIIAILILLTGMSAFAQNGVIRELSGTVELKAPGSSSFVSANPGDTVSANSVISTGFKSTALVAVGSALITVRPLTRLTLMEIQSSQGTETINANLQTGRVRVDVNPPAGTRANMSVSSPVATASVRGTGYELDSKNLKVHHGSVRFSGKRGYTRTVFAGSRSKVQDDGKAADPIQLRYSDLVPSSPPGTGESGGSSGSARNHNENIYGYITIKIEYPD
ncbi:MAG: FecR family protein [Treponema sp.]|nr:FecR family protein [Treponema sp.]